MIGNIFTIQKVFLTPKEFSITKSIISILSHRILTMPIDSIIKDPSRILLTHGIVTMLIDYVIRICHTASWPIGSFPYRLTSSSRICHASSVEGCHASSWPISLEDWWARTSLPLTIDYFRLHVGFASSPLICLYMEITCTPHPKTLLHNQIFHIWEEKP